MENKTFKDWAILELMGHRRLAGMVSDVQIGGASFLRIDIPGEETAITQFYSPQAVYCITPCTEAVARAIAKECEAPVSKWDLPQLYDGKVREPFLGVEDGDEDD